MVVTSFTDSAKQILLENGYLLDKEVIRDGKIHRFGDKQNQWYICYENYIIAGDWQGRLPEIRQFINQEEGYQISIREWEEIEKTAYAERVKREAELRENYECAKADAYDKWEDELSTQGKSEYLDKKKLSPINGIKFGHSVDRRNRKENFIAVKVVNNDDEITSIHYMYDCGKKRFLSKGQLFPYFILFLFIF